MKLIAFDGPTSVGKTTQINLFCEYITSKNMSYVLNDEHGGIRNYINKFHAKNYYKRNLGSLTESFLWFAHYANRIEEVLENNTQTDYIIFDRFIFTPIIYQYLTLNIGRDIDFAEFTDSIKKLFNIGIKLPKYCKLVSFILNGDLESLENRYRTREKRILNQEEKNILRESINLYNSDSLFEIFNSKKILINTTNKNINSIHNEIVEELK